MPVIVRNFWVDAQVDGRQEDLGSGPRAKDGGMTLQVYQRDDGGIVKALSIWGTTRTDGTLVLQIADGKGNLLHTVTTHR